MKKSFISFIHQPKKVILASLIIAIIIGVFGYLNINKVPNLQPIGADSNTESIYNSSSPRDITLGFLSGGRIQSVLVKVGDKVKKGQILSTLDAGNTTGALAQAKAAYDIAEANYQKVINGATGPTIDVAKATVNTAKVNFDQATKQQNTFVSNAYQNLLNSTPEALPTSSTSDYTAPTISGNYNLGNEGQINISIYYTGGGPRFSTSGLVQGDGPVTATTPQPIGNSGLFIKFPSINNISITDWVISIPNKKAANYLTNYNAYQSALQAQSQALALAQATLDQANASLTALVSAARPEDVATAEAQVENASGALQIAEASYKNTIISAPGDGTITAVYISQGQIAVPNASAIQFLGLSN